MSGVRADITSRGDVVQLVDRFYAAVRADHVLGPIFDDVAQTDWATHLPKMYDFWETVLFNRSVFRGNPLAVHLNLSTRVALTEHEFGRWLALFDRQVDALFDGPVAAEAKLRARRIAAVMQHHVGVHTGSVTTTA